MDINFLIQLIAGIFVGGISSYLGSLMLSKKMTVVIDPLSHLALPGVALALIFGIDISFGAFLFLFFGTILIWIIEQKTKLPTETIIAILFSTSLAITFLFLEEHEIHEALFGDISKIGVIDGTITILISLIILFIVSRIYPKLILISISEDLAKSEKISIEKIQLLYLFSISLLIALAVKFVGGLLIAGLTALPAASARNLAKDLKTYKNFASIFGAISAIMGILIYKLTNFPAGSLIILSSFIIFLVSVILKNLQ